MFGVSLSCSVILWPIVLKSFILVDESSSVVGAMSRFLVFVGWMIEVSLRFGLMSTLVMFFFDCV